MFDLAELKVSCVSEMPSEVEFLVQNATAPPRSVLSLMVVVTGGQLVNLEAVTVNVELATAASRDVAMAEPVEAAQFTNVLPVTVNVELLYEMEAASRSMAPPQLAVLFVNVDDAMVTLLPLTSLRYTTLMEPPLLHEAVSAHTRCEW